MLLCPVCHEPLVDDERGAACAGGHRFDRAREGYLYLLRSSKSGDSMGDPKSQARSRRDFLNRGYYAPLRDAMVELVRKRVSGRAASTGGPMTLLDICCGEGYYTSAMGAVPGVDAYGFDLGKEMVRLAAKRGDATYFVANMKDIPVADGAFDMVTELFAPFNEREFARVLAPEGYTLVGRDCYKMYLITNRSNISACKCYEKAGGINKVDDEIIYVYDFKEKN